MTRTEESNIQPTAYLVLRENNSWCDVYRLVPGQVITIGRAPTNRVVINDDVCSRHHCEVFLQNSRWTLRDLDSRNGTMINGATIQTDWPLDDGQWIQIGAHVLGFTHDLTHPLPHIPQEDGIIDEDTAWQKSVLDDDEDEKENGTELKILHRQRKTSLGSKSSVLVSRDRTSRELAKLYRLALEMGQAESQKKLGELVLEGLLSGTNGDIGAILMIPPNLRKEPEPGSLQVIAYQSENEQPYQRVSRQLSQIVLQEHEAVLARDVANDSRLIVRDSLGRIQAESVICAPIRTESRLLGLIHLYSTNLDNQLDKADLEFTHAVADQLAIALGHLKDKESLSVGLARVEGENVALRQQLEIESELVGDSPPMRALKDKIARIAPTDATALIRGESGVGKELVARAVHFSSPRAQGPFVCMNCAALSESLLESELFGHEKGSFTGATDRKIGKFEQADGGTLFLDEVGEMSPAIQAKFLRVLEGHPFERVGGGTAVTVDVRVVAATNRNLEKAVEKKQFRADLYFRLHVVQLTVEPLRKRGSDISLLANYFLQRFAIKTGRQLQGFTPDTLESLEQYQWPGNVRELQNAVERAAILCENDYVTREDIHLSHLGMTDAPTDGGLPEPKQYTTKKLSDMEQEHILETLKHTNWNKSQAAKILGIERSTLDRKLAKYKVNRPSE